MGKSSVVAERQQDGSEAGPGRPIFILGIMQRAGTNYLRDLFTLHPDCTILDNLGEDFLVSELAKLDAYTRSVSKKWNAKWNEGGLDQQLRRRLGDGLLAFLESKKQSPGGRLVTKTPSVHNLKYFHEYFPDAHLVIVVRRGENVVESGVRSFNWSYRAATLQWSRAAWTIANFCQSSETSPERYIIVKYEDLYAAPEAELRRVFEHVGLAAERYDFGVAQDLPVKGSSDLRQNGEAKLHWQPVEKTETFNPLKRADGWPKRRMARFVWMAGRAANAIGYDVEKKYRKKPLWVGYNLAAGHVYTLRKLYQGAARKLAIKRKTKAKTKAKKSLETVANSVARIEASQALLEERERFLQDQLARIDQRIDHLIQNSDKGQGA